MSTCNHGTIRNLNVRATHRILHIKSQQTQCRHTSESFGATICVCVQCTVIPLYAAVVAADPRKNHLLRTLHNHTPTSKSPSIYLKTYALLRPLPCYYPSLKVQLYARHSPSYVQDSCKVDNLSLCISRPKLYALLRPLPLLLTNNTRLEVDKPVLGKNRIFVQVQIHQAFIQ